MSRGLHRHANHHHVIVLTIRSDDTAPVSTTGAVLFVPSIKCATARASTFAASRVRSHRDSTPSARDNRCRLASNISRCRVSFSVRRNTPRLNFQWRLSHTSLPDCRSVRRSGSSSGGFMKSGYFKSGVANAAHEACGLKAEKSSLPAIRNSTVRMVLKLAYPRALRLAA
jgi:hypothetical protein